MTILVAYRKRGTEHWTHLFRVHPEQWEGFFRHARLWKEKFEYAVVRNGAYEAVV